MPKKVRPGSKRLPPWQTPQTQCRGSYSRKMSKKGVFEQAKDTFSLCLEPPEWEAHEAIRVRLRGGLALVRGCLEPGDRWGMCLSLRALEAGTGTAYVVQQRCRARGLHSHPGAAACTSRAKAASRPRALTALGCVFFPRDRLELQNIDWPIYLSLKKTSASPLGLSTHLSKKRAAT